jgi:DNA-binding NtrC family response regulator
MKKRILIVDDEAAIRSLLASFLTQKGYEVMDVALASEALRLVKDQPPQLIISDLQLEDADGLEMIDELKTALPATPVILLTGVLFDPEVVRDVLSKNIACYLEKTSSLDRILREVRRLLGETPSSEAGQPVSEPPRRPKN